MTIEDQLRTVLDERSHHTNDEYDRVGQVGSRINRRRQVNTMLAGVVTVTVMLASVGAVQVLGGHAPPPTDPSPGVPVAPDAPALLRLAVNAVQQQPTLTIRADQFIFTETAQVSHGFMGPSPSSSDGPDPQVLLQEPTKSQHWRSPDGQRDGGERDLAGKQWSEIAKIYGCGPERPNGCEPEPADHSGLPTDPDEMLAYLYAHPIGDGSRDRQAFFDIGMMLDDYVPAAVQAAMFGALGKIGGLTAGEYTLEVAAGSGVSVRFTVDGIMAHLIFHPTTHAYIGFAVTTADDRWGVPAGTMMHESAVLKVGVVDKIGELPQ